jgi:hypothetical protein
MFHWLFKMKKWISSTFFPRKKSLLQNAASDSSDQEHILYVMTISHIYFWVSKHTTQNSIGISEEAVNNTTQKSSLQLLCTTINKVCYKIS